jgi:hypothetical protein
MFEKKTQVRDWLADFVFDGEMECQSFLVLELQELKEVNGKKGFVNATNVTNLLEYVFV